MFQISQNPSLRFSMIVLSQVCAGLGQFVCNIH